MQGDARSGIGEIYIYKREKKRTEGWKGEEEKQGFNRSVEINRYISRVPSRAGFALVSSSPGPVDRILHHPAPFVLKEDVHARAMDDAEEVRDRHCDVRLGHGCVRRGDNFLLLLAECRVLWLRLRLLGERRPRREHEHAFDALGRGLEEDAALRSSARGFGEGGGEAEAEGNRGGVEGRFWMKC